ncbi:PhzF family phenazine biosynthesis protein [Wenzhouxiangella limi]|uniref:PhzF family phenazine biosynthesis protein n=1 Tax=Wenzhouxiangella limi TaxID=2707351 RepID=A0A845VG39_9GAMM|nr:PhzF family phenazine biosynthesis protein [Wenzhouxiangella limi]NDY96179.1 PhzF family phenazine biosynthesis protein [Wenzhouxiangella limi]
MKLDFYQVDAFTERVFEGNPAAVVVLEAWPEDDLLQAIAMENNLSETAFFAPEGDDFRLRWFTPRAEVDLCGHATLATAHVLYEHLDHAGEGVRFLTRSGALSVRREASGYRMDFPAAASALVAVPGDLIDGLGGRKPAAVLAGPDHLAVFEREADVAELRPDFAALARIDGRGVIATAPGENCDFVSRCFFPRLGVPEDPVTGSAHCQMAPYWAERTGRTSLSARQLSARGGRVDCRVRGDRVELLGQAVTCLVGAFHL